MAWFDKTCVYIPDHRLSEAAGNILKEREIAAVLDRLEALGKRKATDCRFVSYIPGLGKRLKAYALSRKVFGRDDFNNADISF